MAGIPFDPQAAQPGKMMLGIDPASLIAGRHALSRKRLEFQRQLLRKGISRFTPINVNMVGVVYDGNHGVSAAAQEGMAVDVLVVDEPAIGFGPILSIPIDDW